MHQMRILIGLKSHSKPLHLFACQGPFRSGLVSSDLEEQNLSNYMSFAWILSYHLKPEFLLPCERLIKRLTGYRARKKSYRLNHSTRTFIRRWQVLANKVIEVCPTSSAPVLFFRISVFHFYSDRHAVGLYSSTGLPASHTHFQS